MKQIVSHSAGFNYKLAMATFSELKGEKAAVIIFSLK
jgi:hypothetical protein